MLLCFLAFARHPKETFTKTNVGFHFPGSNDRRKPTVKATIDGRSLVASVDLRALIRDRIGMGACNGPCPKCGGRDRFFLRKDGLRWGCRKCHPNTSDAIEFLQWLDGLTFRQACECLANGRTLPTVAGRSQPLAPAQVLVQPSAEFVTHAAKLVTDRVADLNKPTGLIGRDYLTSRGVSPHTWEAFRLGFDAWRGAVVLPCLMRGGDVHAIKYRRIGAIGKGGRYTCEKGSREALFGMHLLNEARCLVLVEGEFNAMSIWQACQGLPVDVLSMGSETAHLERVRLIAKEYAKVLLWLDDEEKLGPAMSALGCPGAVLMKSAAALPNGNPAKVDANEMLQVFGGPTLRAVMATKLGLTDAQVCDQINHGASWV